jgi:hypothetical protein
VNAHLTIPTDRPDKNRNAASSATKTLNTPAANGRFEIPRFRPLRTAASGKILPQWREIVACLIGQVLRIVLQMH